MKQSEQPTASKREDGVDYINKMPDGILVLILSCLPHTEEVIRSSILSRRWRYLWTSIPSLSIYCYRGSKHRESFKKRKFKEFVYWVLANKSTDLNRFDLHCSNHYSMSTVGRWIHVAVMKNVKHLDLTFCPKENTEDIEIPSCLVTCSSLEDLRLRSKAGRRLRLPKITGFSQLRVLVLTSVDLFEDKDLITNFLESCPLLETLSLINCAMNKELDLFCISCPNLTLLKIENEGRKLMCGGIRISCPKLDYLELIGDIADNIFFFECLHSLKKAMIKPNLKGNNISVVLFPGISHVEALSIDLHLFLKCINGASDSSLPNLKSLVLSTTMDAFTIDNLNTIIECYPKLEALKLLIEQDFDGEYENLDEAETRSILSSDVRRIQFVEFNGEEPDCCLEWYDDKSEMYFYWGDQESFLLC